jgi:hypothetical protein
MNQLSPPTRQFLSDWREIAEAEPKTATDLIHHIALRTIDASVLDRILSSTQVSLDAQHTYSASRYAAAIDNLVPLINAHVPPIEVLQSDAYHLTDAADILNAGWDVQISGLREFRDRLPAAMSDGDVQGKLNGLIMKALTLQDAALSWRDAAENVSEL